MSIANPADAVNRTLWSDESVVGEFTDTGVAARITHWSDPGEQAALSAVARYVRDTPILDIGVGGGRTVPLLRLLSDDYVAIDYTPEMVAACARNHPGVDVRHGDARDLAGFADASRGFVQFSYNGLDAIGHDDRARALAEMARVLRPGGVLLYSTLNKTGPCYRATPWRRAGSPLAGTWTPLYRTAFAALQAAKAPVHLPRAVRNHRRLRALAVDGGDWALAPLEAHDFGLLVHYTTLAGVRDELSAAGLELVTAFDASTGRAVTPGDDLADVQYFHVVARKPASTPA